MDTLVTATQTLTINFDGLCEPVNPGGVATYGFVVIKDGEIIHRAKGVVGEGLGMTNNVAEYSGVIAALRWIAENHPTCTEVIARGDSNLVINQATGAWRIKSATSKRYAPIVRELAARLNCRFQWIPRELNEDADELSREAYREYVGEPAHR